MSSSTSFVYSFRDVGSLLPFLILFHLLIVDDARLLLGVHYHGYGNWEVIRLDERLGLTKKIAPVELQHHETFLPRAPNLRDRANALLEQVCDRFSYILLFVIFLWICYLHINHECLQVLYPLFLYMLPFPLHFKFNFYALFWYLIYPPTFI